MAILIEDS
jgi:hypothetical protein